MASDAATTTTLPIVPPTPPAPSTGTPDTVVEDPVSDKPGPRGLYLPVGTGSMERRIVEGRGADLRIVYEVPTGAPGSLTAPVRSGDWVYFIAYDGGGPPAAIRRVQNGGVPEDVVLAPDTSSFSISSDGTKLAYVTSGYEAPFRADIVTVDLATRAPHVIEAANGVALTSHTPVWDRDSAHLFFAAASDFSGTDCRTGAHLTAAPDPNDVAGWQHVLIEDAILRTLRVAADAASTADATLITTAGAPAALIDHDGRPALALSTEGFLELTFVDPATGEPLPFRATYLSHDPGVPDLWWGDGRYRIVP